MAQKRMFDRAVIRSDRFVDMPPSTQNLYFHLSIEADDEGFVTPKMVMRTIGASDDDLKVLIGKGYVIPFESGVIVITDWNENNYLDKNRIKPTKHQKELKTLYLTKERKYVLNACLTRIGEDRIEENNNTDFSLEKSGTPQTLEEIKRPLYEKLGKKIPS